MSIEQTPPDANPQLLTDLPDEVLAENGIRLLGKFEGFIDELHSLFEPEHWYDNGIADLTENGLLGRMAKLMVVPGVELALLSSSCRQGANIYTMAWSSDHDQEREPDFFHDDEKRSIVVANSFGTVYAIDPEKPGRFNSPLSYYDVDCERSHFWYAAPDNIMVEHGQDVLHKRPVEARSPGRKLVRIACEESGATKELGDKFKEVANVS
jgi:hypothetical protein